MADLFDSDDITKREKALCARREVNLRERVYPRWVEAGRMTKAQAARELAIMQAIAADYEEASRGR